MCVFVVIDGSDDGFSLWSLREKNQWRWWLCSDL